MKHHCWDSFKQFFSCQCSLLCSPTHIVTCSSEDIVNKGGTQHNIHFPRLLLLPIPFLLFSTPLILTIHCCRFYFVCFEILFPSSKLVPVVFFPVTFPQLIVFAVTFPQLLNIDAHSARMMEVPYCISETHLYSTQNEQNAQARQNHGGRKKVRHTHKRKSF